MVNESRVATRGRRHKPAVTHWPERRGQADEAKLERYRIFRSIVDESVDALVCGDHNGKIIFFNKAAERLFGYRKEEIMGRAVSNLMPARFRKAHREGLRRVASGGRRKIVGKTVELTARRKDGSEFPVELSLSMAKTREGVIFTTHVRDIAKRKKAEAELFQTREYLEKVLNCVPDAVLVLDMQRKFVDGSAAVKRIFGYEKEELVDKSSEKLFPDRREFTAAGDTVRREVVEKGYSEGETSLRRKDGTIFPALFSARMMLDAEGRPSGIVGAIHDVTSFKQVEESLRFERNKVARILESMEDGVYIVNRNYDIEYLNPALKAEFGEPGGRRCYEYFHDRKRACPWCPNQRVFAGETIHWDWYSFKNDKTYELIDTPLENPDGTISKLEIFRDITSRKRAEEKIRRLGLRNQKLLEAAGQGIYGVDSKGRIVFVNPAAAEVLGYRVDELEGRYSHRLWHHSKPDGSPYPEDDCPIYTAHRKGGSFRITGEMFFKKDGTAFPVEYTVNPVWEDKAVAGAVVVFDDISERLRTESELRRINRALEALSLCNEKMIRAPDEKGLLGDVCEIIVRTGGYLFAWAGYAVVGKKLTIRPVVHAGHDHGFFDKLPAIWNATEDREGPVRKAIRRGEPALIRNLAGDRRFIPWKEDALRRGYAAAAAFPLKVHGRVSGVICIYSDMPGAFDEKEAELLAELADDLAYGIENIRTRKAREKAEAKLQESLDRLKRTVDGTTQALALAAEARDPYTAGHQRRVAALACAIAGEMGLNGEAVDCLHVAGMLHDVGKISIPAEILTKPGRLSELEMDMVRKHAEASYDILRQVDFPWPVARIVRQHHERLDGTGYPQGLTGDAILPEARILALADTVEAMTSHRPYRPGLGLQEALKEIKRGRGILFEPEVVDACLRLFREKRFEFEKAA